MNPARVFASPVAVFLICAPRSFLLGILMLSAVVGVARGSDGPASVDIPASDPAFAFQGRIDLRTPGAPVLVWQSSAVRVAFEGPELALHFGETRDQVFLDVTVDGDTRVIRVPAGDAWIPWPAPLSAGLHRVSVVKRSEAAAGTTRFLGIRVGKGTRLSAYPFSMHARRFLFLGDSITVGACDEDGPADQWEDRRTHNAGESYATLTAAALDASLQNISVSGMGIVEGYVDITVKQVWNRMYPTPESPKADLSAYTPDVIFLNYGQNDASHTRVRSAPLPATFVPEYLDLLASIRAAYPSAEIVLLRGGMHENTNDPSFIAAFDRVANAARARDPRISAFAFTHFTDTHPRVPDHREMARELIEWLRRPPFMGGR